jgi:hypothetical protein
MDDVALDRRQPAARAAPAGGRDGRWVAWLHATIGWGAVVLAACHDLAAAPVAPVPGRGLPWLATQLAIGMSVIVPGAVMAWSAWRPAQRATGLVATAVLFAVCAWQMLTWHVLFPAVFAALSVVDGIVMSWAVTRHWAPRLLLTAAFAIGGLSLVAASGGVDRSGGRHRAAFVP